ncbi:MAG: alpha-2-macroglobulin family protein, partial [Chitinivibrionales bacterium]
RVIHAEWVESQGEVTRYSFKADEDMAPNVYAHVTYLQPHLQAGNDLPIRMYGVIPIQVVDPQTRLKPVLKAPDEFTPETKAKISVSEDNGRPMTYTIAVVDEGLLDLTRFATPEPWNNFYKREALGVKTWDLFDMVAGAYGAKLEQLLAIGGGGDEAEPGSRKANRFPPMVRFMGPFDLDKNRTNSHTIDIPQYIGSVRVMVVAGSQGAYGATDKAVFVRKPLMVMGTLPRVLGPQEDVSFPASVFALKENVKNVAVRVKTEGPIDIVGDAQQQLTFSETGDQLVTFKLKATEGTGAARVSLTATGAGEQAHQDIDVEVRAHGVPITEVIDTTIKAGEAWNTQVRLPGIAGTNSAYLEVTRIPPINLGKRLNALIRYPHGCVEQTTSSVFPQVYLNKLLRLSPTREEEVEKHIKAGINRLKGFQTASGGFGYWPGRSSAHDWSSSYAGHFLVEAKLAGYSVPSGMLGLWKQHQRTQALSWTTGAKRSALTQAYRLYTLALAGAPELGAMNRLKERDNLSDAALYRLAAAYQLAGQKEAAMELARKGNTDITPYRELSNTFGSSLRDKAMIMETLCLLGQSTTAAKLAREISRQLSGGKWMSTQTTAYALIAMARFVDVDNSAENIEFTLNWQNTGGQVVKSTMPVCQHPLDVGNQTEASISLKNNSGGSIFPRIIMEGLPAPGTETAAQNGMYLNVTYTDLKGRTIDPTELEQGTDFAAVVTVNHTGMEERYEEIALSHLVASGWEIHNKRMDTGNEHRGENGELFDYQDIRDDRVYTYFDLSRRQSKTVKILLNASYLGRFYLPALSVETMYDATINARVPGKWVTVVNPSR